VKAGHGLCQANMRRSRTILGVVGCWAGLLLFLVGKASSPEAFVVGWDAKFVRRPVACKNYNGFSLGDEDVGQVRQAEPSKDEEKFEITNELKSAVLNLEDPKELRAVINQGKKALFKFRLDDQTRKLQPDPNIKKKHEFRIKLAERMLEKIEKEAEAAENHEAAAIPTYTEWMETYCDLAAYKASWSNPRNRKSYKGERNWNRELQWKKQSQKKNGYRYDQHVDSFEPKDGDPASRDRWNDGQLSWEDFVAKGGHEWWKEQKKLRREANKRRDKEELAAYKAEHQSWKQKWAAEAEVRRQELGQTA